MNGIGDKDPRPDTIEGAPQADTLKPRIMGFLSSHDADLTAISIR